MDSWRKVRDFDYEVSSAGQIRNSTGHIMSLKKTYDGYLEIGLRRKGFRKFIRVHRIVAAAFLDNPENKPQVNHIDGNKKNNHVSNLEYCTGSENMKHSYGLGIHDQKGENNNTAKLTEADVLAIRISTQPHKELAKKYKTTPYSIQRIIRKERWAHI